MAKAPFGVLLLHGFSSHVNVIDPVVPRLEKHGIPYRLPVLRGHMGQPTDLIGVTWEDWVKDGQKALDELLEECEKVIPVALSMGSLVAFELVRKQQEKIQALVVLAPALKSKSKLVVLAPLIARVQKTYKFKYDPKAYFETAQMETNQNYHDLPTSSVLEFLNFGKYSRQPELLSSIKVPLLIIGSEHDRTIDPQIFRFLYNTVSSQDKQLVWFHRSGHEMLRDEQREEILDTIEAYLVKQLEKSTSSAAVQS